MLHRRRCVLVLLGVVACAAVLAAVSRRHWLAAGTTRIYEPREEASKQLEEVPRPANHQTTNASGLHSPDPSLYIRHNPSHSQHKLHNNSELHLLENKPQSADPKPHDSKLQTSNYELGGEDAFISQRTGWRVGNDHRGYVLAGDYWEQQSSACRNLQNLQCWAGKLNIHVVEPYTSLSLMKTPFAPMSRENLRFSDLFDLESWNHQSTELGHSEIVPWNEFIKVAPRSVILVWFLFPSKEELAQMDLVLKNSSYSMSGALTSVICTTTKIVKWPKTNEIVFLEANGFNIVQRLCLDFQFIPYISVAVFNKLIYGTNHPRETVVYFKEWRGTGSLPRIPVDSKECDNCTAHERMTPSKQLIARAETYIDQYLSGGDYIAVMVRIEKAMISLKHRDDAVPYCLEETLKEWWKLRNESGIQTTFLAADVGKYGSVTLASRAELKDHITDFHKFFKQIYGAETSVEEWERTFEEVAGTTDSGYIALLQKLIATRSKCVLFVGGGAFQKHALHLYRQLHSDNECVRIVHKCTAESKLPYKAIY